MKAEKQAKVFERKRTRLETVLPMDTPFAITLEVSSFCDLQCHFCVHYDKNALKEAGFTYGNMDMGLFKKIVDDAAVMNQQVKKLKLCGMGECLLNPHLPEMIKYANNSGAFERVDLFTNGIALNPELNLKLVEAGLEWVNISINGLSSEQYEANCGRKINYDKFIKNIRHLYDHKKQLEIYIKLGDNGYSEEEKQKFYDVFGDICDTIFIETIVDNAWGDAKVRKANMENDFFGQEMIERKVCDLIFTRMTIAWDGRVKMCCADWKGDYLVGDVKRESLSEIWNGKELRKIYMQQLKGQKENFELCRGCDKYMTLTPDNIDPYADELLKRYEELDRDC